MSIKNACVPICTLWVSTAAYNVSFVLEKIKKILGCFYFSASGLIFTSLMLILFILLMENKLPKEKVKYLFIEIIVLLLVFMVARQEQYLLIFFLLEVGAVMLLFLLIKDTNSNVVNPQTVTKLIPLVFDTNMFFISRVDGTYFTKHYTNYQAGCTPVSDFSSFQNSLIALNPLPTIISLSFLITITLWIIVYGTRLYVVGFSNMKNTLGFLKNTEITFFSLKKKYKSKFRLSNVFPFS